MTDTVEIPEGRFVRHALSLLANDDKVLQQFVPILRPEYFEAPEVRWVVRQILFQWQRQKTAPGSEWLRFRLEQVDEARLSRMSVGLLNALLEDAEHPPTGKTRQAVVADLEDVLRRGALKNAIVTAAERFDSGDEEGAFKLMDDAKRVRLPNDKWTMVPPEDVEAFIRRRDPAHLRELAIPTGLRTLDDWLHGGLRAKELAVWLATTGRGKSMGLVQVGARATVSGLNVVHFSFENTEEETEARYVANISGIPIDDLGSAKAAELEEALGVMGHGKVYAKLLPGKKTTAETLSHHIANLEDRGIAVGLVVVDYGDLMKSSYGHERKYDEQNSVFEELRELAIEHNVPVWTGTQGNRKALEDPWVGLEYIADSFAKAFVADIVLAFCDGREDQREEAGVDGFLRVCKFRRGRPDRVLGVRTPLDRARFVDKGEVVKPDFSRRAAKEPAGARSDAAED